MSLGLTRAGFLITAAFDVEAKPVSTYKQNLGNHVFVADVRTVTSAKLAAMGGMKPGTVTLVAGGPPCQGFSVQRRKGEEDPRNSLPSEFLRLILDIDPPFFLFENVPGIKGRHGEAILKAFLADATSAGYVCHSQTLDAVNYGVPQLRRRLFIVGEKPVNEKTWFRFPRSISSPNSEETKVCNALADLPEPPEDFAPHPQFTHHRRTRLSALNLKRLANVPQGGGMEDLPEELRVNCHRNGADKIGHRYVYGRLHWERPASTITGRFDSFTRGRFGHPLANRNITLREGARLQSFPDDYTFVGGQEEIALQIGNAVPPKLAEVLGASIRDAWERRQRGEPPSQHQQFSLFPSSPRPPRP